MSEAPAQAVPSTAPEPAGLPPNAIVARFWAHGLALLALYLTVAVAWGKRNAWPDDLVLCLLLMPMGMLVTSTLYMVYRFGIVLDSEKGQQEQLIASLVLAVGLASGQMFLMTLGLAALGTAWLRPGRPGIDWTEWLKVPLILLTVLPFWMDFEGGRQQWLGIFDDRQTNPEYQLPLALATSQSRVLAYCGLLSLVLLLHGRIFWITLPILPAYLVGVTWMPRWIPDWDRLPKWVQQAQPWLVGLVLLAVVSWFATRIERASHRWISGDTLRRWIEERRYPPWIAVLVVVVVQTLPFRSLRFGTEQVIAVVGTVIMLALLLHLRWRSGRGPIHSRSVAMVAGALVMTLMAEFATSEPLRRLALGFVFIGLLSWHRFWPMRVFAVSSITSMVLLAVPDSLLAGPLPAAAVGPVRIAAGVLLLAVLAWLVNRPLPPAGAAGYDEGSWVPSKRYAFILLGLMMLFQTAAAFWPDHELDDIARATARGPAAGDSGADPGLTAEHPTTYRLAAESGVVHVSIASLRMAPGLLESPERWYRRYGWKIVSQERVVHPQGEATALRIRREQDDREVSVLWWFEQGRRRFNSHLYARRVLWSGWHLADRRLRLVRLETSARMSPLELTEFADRYDWFENAWGQPLPAR